MSDTAHAQVWRARRIALRADLRLALASAEPPALTLARCADALVEHLDVPLAAFWWAATPGAAAELVATSRAQSPEGIPRRLPLDAAGAGFVSDAASAPDVAPAALVAAERLVSVAVQPLFAGDRQVGVCVAYGSAALDDDALEALAAAADLVALSLEGRRVDGTLRDTLEVKDREATRCAEAQRNASLQHRVSQLLAGALSFGAVAPALARVVAETLGWDIGAVWHFELPVNLRHVTVWHADDALKPLASHLARLAPARAPGIVSAVVESAGPVFWPDAAQRALAEDPGEPRVVHAALGVPITGDGAVLGALVLLHRQHRDVDGERMQTCASLGAMIGQFLRRKVVEDQLIQAQKMEAVGKLAGGVAHDFNNILTVITGYAAMSLEAVQHGSPLHDQSHEILSAAERATSLVNQLLAFSRKQVFHPRMIDLNIVVGDMERMLRRLIGEDVRLVTRRPEQPSMVCADLVHVEQVIVNLAVNARDAMPQGGSLHIEIAHVELEPPGRENGDAAPAPHVKITVRDTGVGMSDDVRSHAFEPFFTTKESGKGTGLGLATAYGIVRQNGGHIRVDSEPGKGAQFTILFPRVTQGERPAATRDPRLTAARGTETVLLVEDEKPVRRLARNILKASGYDVLEAGTAEEALQICSSAQKPIHLLLTDVVMPGMNGVALSHRLASLTPGLRVLYMSGYAEDSLFDGYALARGVAFLEKPFTPSGLTQRVRQVLDAPRPASGAPPERVAPEPTRRP